jgi:cell division septation protein DedD
MRRQRSRFQGRLVTITVAVTALAGCGEDEDAPPDGAGLEARIQRERAEAAALARQEERINSLERELARANTRPRRQRQASGSGDGDTIIVTPGTAPGVSGAPPASSQSVGDWPAGTAAWTVVLASVSTSEEAERIAQDARDAGLGQVGILYSSDFASLRPGYWVAFSGILDEASTSYAEDEAQSAGFSGAYARYVSD